MARPSGPKTRCGGRWTEAAFNSFIKNNLRQASRKWAPIGDAKKSANVSRGVYECASCKKHVAPTMRRGRKRETNIYVDHIDPIIDPSVGFTTWDDCVNRMFCEVSNLQVLCKECHDVKSKEERAIAAGRRKKEKE